MRARTLKMPAVLTVSLMGLGVASCGSVVEFDGGADVVADEPSDGSDTGTGCAAACQAMFSMELQGCMGTTTADGGSVCVPTDDAGSGICGVASIAHAGSTTCCCEPLV